MTLTRRSFLPGVSLAAAAAVVAVVVAGGIPAASAATATTYSVTYAGTDAHSLDPAMLPVYVHGGGVGPVGNGQSSSNATFEIGLNLPVGAKVTSIAISYSHCASLSTQPTMIVAVTTPSTGTDGNIWTQSAGKTCSVTTAVARGAPLTTVQTGNRYVVEMKWGASYGPGAPPSSVLWGTTVKYTCTAPCVL